MEAKCCSLGAEELRCHKRNEWHLTGEETGIFFSFCPFCGWDLTSGFWPAEGEALLEQIQSIFDSCENSNITFPANSRDGRSQLRVCFDVDGLLAVEEGEYADRKVIDESVAVLKKLKECGCTIIIQTARYMRKFSGDQRLARKHGHMELQIWLEQHGIPFDEIYLGKASADFYLDDKACRIQTDDAVGGVYGWARNFIPILKKEVEKRALV